MKVALFILPFCLLITLSLKRPPNLRQFITDKHEIQIRITEDDDFEDNNIRRHPDLLKNNFILALAGDGGSGSIRSRNLLSGVPGCFYSIAINKYALDQTENHHTNIYIATLLQLFNKGSPEIENTGIDYCHINFKNRDCLFRLLHQYYTLPLFVNKDNLPLLILPQYLAITHLQPPFLLGTRTLYILEQHCLSGIFIVTSYDISVIEKTLFPP